MSSGQDSEDIPHSFSEAFGLTSENKELKHKNMQAQPIFLPFGRVSCHVCTSGVTLLVIGIP
jgi:hypothetical protein